MDEEIVVAPATQEADITIPALAEHKGDTFARGILKDQGYPSGVIDALFENRNSFPLRIWVVDNSGSMRINDGMRILEESTQSNVKFATCTRWAELCQCIEYHIDMSGSLNAPTIFRLLNHPGKDAGDQQFSVANDSNQSMEENVKRAKQIMSLTQPDMYTPLVQHVKEIIDHVKTMEENLRKNHQKVAVIIATDGIPSDGDKSSFVRYLKGLGDLPVWLVFRLCTDDDSVIDYYSDFDMLLEQPIEVLDDFRSEAMEIYRVNPWLNYGLILHRSRELGFKHRLFDLIDERPLTKDELLEYCVLLFGKESMKSCPNPNDDWKTFRAIVARIMENEPKAWNPIRLRVLPWIDLNMLDYHYEGIDSCCCTLS